MKPQNLTDRIHGSMLLFLILITLAPGAAVPQNKPAEPLVFKKCWITPTETPVDRMVASDNDKILFYVESGGKMGALDLTTGSGIWKTEFGGELISELKVDENAVFIATTTGTTAGGAIGQTILRAVSKQTGITIWSAAIGEANEVDLFVDSESIYAISDSGMVFSINKSGGAARWRERLGEKLAGNAYFDGKNLAIPVESGKIFLFSPINGGKLRTILFPSPSTAAYISDDHTIIVGDKKGNITSRDAQTGRVNWKFRNGAQISSIVGGGDGILISSFDNFVYKILPSDGHVLWKRRLSARVIEKPAVSKDTAVVRVLGESGVSVIDLGSGRFLGKVSATAEDEMPEAALVTGYGAILVAQNNGITLFSTSVCASN